MATDTVGAFPRNHIKDLMSSSGCYLTPEMAREVGHIAQGSALVNLDQQLLGSSSQWRQRFNTQALHKQTQGARQAVSGAAGTVQEVKNSLRAQKVAALQDNQVRELHHVAKETVRAAQKDMAPYVHSSVDRLKQYCDHLGVTDRFTGYRHNLNRGSRDPVRLGFSWLKKEPVNLYLGKTPAPGPIRPPQRHVLPRRPSAQEPDFNKSRLPDSARHPPPPYHKSWSSLEKVGMNTVYPGRSEYKDRYPRPPASKPRPYPLNPTPDFSIFGRPSASAEYVKKKSEYKATYTFPDGSKIEKRPWIRK